MRIIHPRPQAGRQSDLGVDFIDGIATVEALHPERERALRQHGYTIEADPEVEAPFQEALGEPIVDLNTLTIPELRDIADTEGIDLPAKALKGEIVDLISRAPAASIEGTPFFDLTVEQLRETATIEGLDVAPDATRQDIINAFLQAGAESD